MHRVVRIALASLVLTGGVAAADRTQLGLFFGPRVFSNDSLLGYIDDAPAHPTLNNGIQFGFRIARPFLPWLVPELELGMAPVGTPAVRAMGGSTANATSVFWLDPRLHLRFELLPGRRVQPFLVVGGGAPISLSSARKTFATDLLGDGYLGAGVRFDTHKSFTVRFDARVSLMPGVERYIAPEYDFAFGIEFALGKAPRRVGETVVAAASDRDSDGILDAQDKCPDREEDADGFEDADGCPDIDNDLDRVLDIADRCPNVPETYNGLDDDDGCPDSLPPEIDGLRGTIEGLLYAEGETVVRDSAQANVKKLAKVMADFPSIKVVLIGHTDNVEAKQFAKPVEGEPPPDLDALATDLSRARAEAVKQALVAAGVAAPRILVEGHGAEEPVTENDKPKGRLANRRVEIKLYVPPR